MLVFALHRTFIQTYCRLFKPVALLCSKIGLIKHHLKVVALSAAGVVAIA